MNQNEKAPVSGMNQNQKATMTGLYATACLMIIVGIVVYAYQLTTRIEICNPPKGCDYSATNITGIVIAAIGVIIAIGAIVARQQLPKRDMSLPFPK